MSMELLNDLKEAKKQIEDLIRIIGNMEHKNQLFRERVAKLGLTEKQLNGIQDAYDDLIK